MSLILTVAVFMLLPRGTADLGGMGRGQNGELKTVRELAVLLQDFSEPLAGFDKSYYQKGGTTPSLLAEIETETPSGPDESDTPRQRVHTSVTVEEDTASHIEMTMRKSVQVDPDSPNKGQVSSYTSSSVVLTFERQMTVYIAPGAVLYEIDATDSSAESSDGESHKQNTSFKFFLYMEQGEVLMRFDRFESTYDHMGGPDLTEIYGKWIDFTPLAEAGESIDSFLDDFIETNQHNFDVLSFLGDTIDRCQEDGFLCSGDIYRMKDELFGDFCKELLNKQEGGSAEYFENPYEGGFEVNFYDKHSPRLTLDFKNKEDNYHRESEYGGVTVSVTANASVAERDEFALKYIDNTVVKAPEWKDRIGLEELKKLIVR